MLQLPLLPANKWSCTPTRPPTQPIAKILDRILGQETAQLYARAELRELMYLHEQGAELTKEEVIVIKGAMDMVCVCAAFSSTAISKETLPPCLHIGQRGKGTI